MKTKVNEKVKAPEFLVKQRPRKRTAIDSQQNILTVTGKEPGFRYRVVNDVGDRVTGLEDQGYEIVDHDGIQIGGSKIGSTKDAGSKYQVNVGQGIKGILMRLPEEFGKEDDDLKRKRTKQSEETMYNDASVDYGTVKVERK